MARARRRWGVMELAWDIFKNLLAIICTIFVVGVFKSGPPKKLPGGE